VTNVVIFGAGGLGREVLVVLRDMRASGQDINCVAFVIDSATDAPKSVHGIPIHHGLSRFGGDADIQFVVALGDPTLRRRTASAIERTFGPRFATVIHPRAWIGSPVTVGAGSMIMAHASVTTDVRIGCHVLLNPQVSVAHDCVLEDYATLAPAVALAGGVRLREGCDLGTGANIIPRQEVGSWSKVGAGAVVIRGVPPNTTVAGVPARVIAERPQGWHDAAASEP
jgi:sugar O-acyltransferase (sialic acid O-acetyltransferase NeuD family)